MNDTTRRNISIVSNGETGDRSGVVVKVVLLLPLNDTTVGSEIGTTCTAGVTVAAVGVVIVVVVTASIMVLLHCVV